MSSGLLVFGFIVSLRRVAGGGPGEETERNEVDAPETRDRGKLMAAMDAINDRFGRGAIHVGSAVGIGPPRDWSMRQERLTPPNTQPNGAICRLHGFETPDAA